jgi:hypothetical protein
MEADVARQQGAAPQIPTVRPWSVEEWLASEAPCNELARRACSDELFMSWEWLSRWWDCYGESLGAQPDILAFYRGMELVGLAPLYQRRLLRNGVIVMGSVQVMGLSWRDPTRLISEYLDVIAPSEHRHAVRHACLRYLLQRPGWAEFVVGFTAAGREWREAYGSCVSPAEHYVRELDRCVSYEADLSAGFGAYLKYLSQSTRRSVWNLRRRVAGYGKIELEAVHAPAIESAFADLNHLHELRWGRPAFTGQRLEFHTALARRLVARDELVLSRLRVSGAVVSVLYDIRKERRQYNIKMGFDPRFSSQISLGLIHLGFAMEAAAESGVPCYDFLAGPGQTSDFKRLLSQNRRELSSVQMLRGRLLTSVFRLRDRIPL